MLVLTVSESHCAQSVCCGAIGSSIAHFTNRLARDSEGDDGVSPSTPPSFRKFISAFALIPKAVPKDDFRPSFQLPWVSIAGESQAFHRFQEKMKPVVGSANESVLDRPDKTGLRTESRFLK
jgi:hypothetical protein